MSLESSIQEMSENPKLLHSVKALDTPIFSVEKELFSIEENKEIERWSVRHPGAVVILPLLNEKEIILVSQYRKVFEKTLLEIPAGLINENEDPLDAAKRELREETGYRAMSWTSLGEYYPTPGFCNEVYHVYIARNLIPGSQDLDDDERVAVKILSVDKLRDLIKNNSIKDAKTVLAFYLGLNNFI